MNNTVEIQLCPFCEEAIEGKHPFGRSKKVKRMEALVLVIGGSHGGWGGRYDRINFSDEICGDCFDAIMKKCDELEALIESLKPEKSKRHKLFGII